MADDGTLSIEQVVDYEAIFEPFEDDTYTTRTDLAPADWLILLQARERRGDDDTILDVNSDDLDGRLVVENVDLLAVPTPDPPSGQWIRLDLKADDTAAIPSSGCWELTRVDRNDVTNVSPLGEGKLTLRRRITNAGP